MKVIRKLNEASKQQIDIARVQYESAETEEEKINILIDFLKDCGLEDVPANSISKFDFDFLNKWINAFKWEEAGASSNEFIKLLNYHTNTKNDRLSSDIIVGDQDYFMKAYNCYAGTDYFSEPKSFEYNPIFAKSLYTNSGQDVKYIIRAWSQLFEKINRSDLIKLFYEIDDDIDVINFIKNNDIVNWPVRSYSDIARRISSFSPESADNLGNSNDEKEIKRLLNKSDENKEIARRELEKSN